MGNIFGCCKKKHDEEIMVGYDGKHFAWSISRTRDKKKKGASKKYSDKKEDFNFSFKFK